MGKFYSLLAITLCGFGVEVVRAEMLLVNCDGTEDSATVQGAIDMAEDGDIIVVLPNDCNEEGRYFENINLLGKAITLRNRNPRNWDNIKATIIDGSLVEQSTVTIENGEGSDTRILGLTITGGTGTSVVADYQGFNDLDLIKHGGGIRCVDVSPLIANCRIVNNYSIDGGGVGIIGGAPQFIGCEIRTNIASNEKIPTMPGWVWLATGGGVSVWSSSATFKSCTIADNQTVFGSAVITITGTPGVQVSSLLPVPEEPVIIDNCLISGNIADQGPGSGAAVGGGGLSFLGTDPMTLAGIPLKARVTDCVITGNSATHGGAVQVGGSADNDIVIDRCQLSNNTVSNQGGGIHLSEGALDLRNSWITDNLVSSDSLAFRSGGGIYAGAQTKLSMHGCTVANNAFDTGSSFNRGGGLYANFSSDVDIFNSIIHGNQAELGPQLYAKSLADLVLDYCNLQGGTVAIEGTATTSNIIDVDPMFADAINGDYHLNSDSLCIDAGDPSYTALAGETDIDGDHRVQGSAIDMGADETND